MGAVQLCCGQPILHNARNAFRRWCPAKALFRFAICVHLFVVSCDRFFSDVRFEEEVADDGVDGVVGGEVEHLRGEVCGLLGHVRPAFGAEAGLDRRDVVVEGDVDLGDEGRRGGAVTVESGPPAAAAAAAETARVGEVPVADQDWGDDELAVDAPVVVAGAALGLVGGGDQLHGVPSCSGVPDVPDRSRSFT